MRVLFQGLSEYELLVLRSYIERSSRDLDWNITRVSDKKHVEAAIDSLIARKIVHYDHWLSSEIYDYLLQHPDAIGPRSQPWT